VTKRCLLWGLLGLVACSRPDPTTLPELTLVFSGRIDGEIEPCG